MFLPPQQEARKHVICFTFILFAYKYLKVTGTSWRPWTVKHQVSRILYHEAAIYIRSHYYNANEAFLFTRECRLTLWTANCNSCYVIFMELEVWLFSWVTCIMKNSVNNVHNLKCSLRNKSAASWMVVLSLRRESHVALHNDICDITTSFRSGYW